MSSPEFGSRYCELRATPPEQFVREVWWASLPPQTRLVAVVIRFFDPQFFAPDYELIAEAGKLKKWQDLRPYVSDFVNHPRSRNPLRRALRLRISVRRLRRLMRATLTASAPAQARRAPARLPQTWI